MMYQNKSIKYLLCMTCGLCLALSVLLAMLVVSVTGRNRSDTRSMTADKSKLIYGNSEAKVTELPINKPYEIKTGDFEKLEKTYKVCRKIVDTRDDNQKEEKAMKVENTQSTTSTTAATSVDNTTVTTTVSSQTAPTTAATRDYEEIETETVSNGKEPFNYNDVSSIADEMSTLGDFVDTLEPEEILWDVSEYEESECVKITLDSELGNVVLFVRPEEGIPSGEEDTGIVSSEEIEEWEWLEENRTAGCNISSVTWLDSEFGIAPVRDTGIGSTLAELTDKYLCVNGGATTLYRASDVIEDQNKLNAILADENLFTFVGGRVYSIGSYLDKYYNGTEHVFRFEDCDYIVQYGCNSIMDHNYTTGSWIIEYAVKEDSVVGISFMNKSYYTAEQDTLSSGSEPAVVITTTTPDQSEDEYEDFGDEIWNESDEEITTDETESEPDDSEESEEF